MKLIADSGSTKTSWRVLDESGEVGIIQTSGINPFFRTSDDIEQELREKLLPFATTVQSVHFYGAGIINDEKAVVIKHALKQMYGEILIETFSDVLGAARSVSGTEAGIVCILGTGSNACYYDGSKIIDNIPPLGFILGDEGSGAVIGKNLLGDYFKRVMPASLRLKFQERYKVTKESVLDSVYRQEKPNQFLAGFSMFLSEHIDDLYCREFIRQNLLAFITRNVKMIPQSIGLPIHFVGSVAYYFQDILKTVLKEEELTLGNIIKEPIGGLLQFHKNNK